MERLVELVPAAGLERAVEPALQSVLRTQVVELELQSEQAVAPLEPK